MFNRSVGLEEVGFEVSVEEIAGNAFHRVIDGEDMNLLAVGNITDGGDVDAIAETHTEILTNNLVHADLGFLEVFVCKNDADCVLALLSLDHDVVTAEEVQFLHFGRVKRDDGVIVVRGILDHETIRGALLGELDGLLEIDEMFY